MKLLFGLKGHLLKYNPLIREEQVKGILEQSPTNIVANTLVAIIAFFGFYNSSSENNFYQITWLAVTLVLSSIQTYEVVRFKRQGLNKKNQKELMGGSLIAAFIIGILWCFFVYLFSLHESTSTYLMIALVCGMLAGAITSTSIYLPLYLLFSIPFIITFLVFLASSDLSQHHILSILMLVYYFMCLNMAVILNKRVIESFRLRFENNDVVKKLKEQKRIAEKASQSKSKFF